MNSEWLPTVQAMRLQVGATHPGSHVRIHAITSDCDRYHRVIREPRLRRKHGRPRGHRKFYTCRTRVWRER